MTFQEIKTRKHGVEFVRTPLGYFFRNKFAALIYLRGERVYVIQLRTPGIKASRFYKRVYFGTERPANRTLWKIALIHFPLHFIYQVVRTLVVAACSIVGYPLYLVGKLTKIVGLLLMLLPNCAIQEMKDFFEVQYVGRGIKEF